MGKNKNPYIITNDGRTIRFPDPSIKKNDTIKWNLKMNSITNFFKYEVGCYVTIIGGNNIGRTGVISKIEKHPGSYEIIHVQDERGNSFSTRLDNIFVIGTKEPEITLVKKHVHLSIVEEKERKTKRKIGEDEGDKEEETEK